jgi:Mn2+/Fe2+ NRAMP family transporter
MAAPSHYPAFIAIVPAVIVTAMYGERGVGALLILSQVISACSPPSR